jgi:hypothetical protein
MFTKSRIETVLANLAMPYTERVEPNRDMQRNESDEPKLVLSKIDIMLPILDTP